MIFAEHLQAKSNIRILLMITRTHSSERSVDVDIASPVARIH